MRSVPAQYVQKVLRMGIPLLILCLLISPATAITETHTRDVYTFHAIAPDDKMIDSFRCDDMQSDTTQQYVLNAYGDYYTVSMNSTKDWGTWTFNVDCTYPNGTVSSEQYTKFAPLSNTYDLLFQGYWCEAGFAWETQVFVTLSPLVVAESNVWIPTPTAGIAIQYNAIADYDPIAFYEVSGSSTGLINDVTIYFVTADEFAAHSHNDLMAGLIGGATSAVGSITETMWLTAISGIECIPGVGPYISAGLTISGMVIGEVFWWLKFLFIDNGLLTFLTIEFFVLGEAMMNSRSLVQMLKKVVVNHIKIYEFFLKIATWAIEILAKIIQAIGSLLPFP